LIKYNRDLGKQRRINDFNSFLENISNFSLQKSSTNSIHKPSFHSNFSHRHTPQPVPTARSNSNPRSNNNTHRNTDHFGLPINFDQAEANYLHLEPQKKESQYISLNSRNNLDKFYFNQLPIKNEHIPKNLPQCLEEELLIENKSTSIFQQVKDEESIDNLTKRVKVESISSQTDLPRDSYEGISSKRDKNNSYISNSQDHSSKLENIQQNPSMYFIIFPYFIKVLDTLQ